MSRYIIKFSKNGYAKYTSHLDIMRLFRRSLKKSNILLDYSKGFNPHPKMNFGQPLSLGYSSECELLDIETTESYKPWFILDSLKSIMPLGIEIIDCVSIDDCYKSIAAMADSAVYEISFNVNIDDNIRNIFNNYINQESILAFKKIKKTKELVEVSIKDKIRNISIIEQNKKLTILTELDSGSYSNLSPELLIQSFLTYANIGLSRYDVEVNRKQIKFLENLSF